MLYSKCSYEAYCLVSYYVEEDSKDLLSFKIYSVTLTFCGLKWPAKLEGDSENTDAGCVGNLPNCVKSNTQESTLSSSQPPNSIRCKSLIIQPIIIIKANTTGRQYVTFWFVDVQAHILSEIGADSTAEWSSGLNKLSALHLVLLKRLGEGSIYWTTFDTTASQYKRLMSSVSLHTIVSVKTISHLMSIIWSCNNVTYLCQ